MSSRLEQLCEQLGMRMTDQRRVIARVLSASHDHPDVEELHRRSVAVDPRISIATVYRTVRMFEENGILSRLDLGDGRARRRRLDAGLPDLVAETPPVGRREQVAEPAHERAQRVQKPQRPAREPAKQSSHLSYNRGVAEL